MISDLNTSDAFRWQLILLLDTRSSASPQSTPIYSRIPEQKNVPEMRLRQCFSTVIRPSNEALNKKVQLAIFEKIRFEVFSLLKDGQKLEQNH